MDLKDTILYNAGSDLGITLGDSTYKAYVDGDKFKIEFVLTIPKEIVAGVPGALGIVGEIKDSHGNVMSEQQIKDEPGRIYFPIAKTPVRIVGTPTGNITFEVDSKNSMFHLVLPLGNSGKTQSSQ